MQPFVAAYKDAVSKFATVHRYDKNCYIVEKNRAPAPGGKKVIEALMGSDKSGCLLHLSSISLSLRPHFQSLKLWTKSET